MSATVAPTVEPAVLSARRAFQALGEPRDEAPLALAPRSLGLLAKLTPLAPVAATRAQLERVHSPAYIDNVEQLSQREEGGSAGEDAPFSQFAFDIASLSAGGVVRAVDAVMRGEVAAAYALTRPPGHHATRTSAWASVSLTTSQ